MVQRNPDLYCNINPLPPPPPIPPSSISMKLLHFPEVSQAERMKSMRQADRRCYGRAKVALEADTHRKGSFVTLVSKPYAIAKSVCVAGQGSWECDAHWFWEGIWKRLWSSITPLCHMSTHEISSSVSLLHFLHLLLLSVSFSLSVTTKCSPTRGTWWLWWVHMKTCQWRYEALSSV